MRMVPSFEYVWLRTVSTHTPVPTITKHRHAQYDRLWTSPGNPSPSPYKSAKCSMSTAAGSAPGRWPAVKIARIASVQPSSNRNSFFPTHDSNHHPPLHLGLASNRCSLPDASVMLTPLYAALPVVNGPTTGPTMIYPYSVPSHHCHKTLLRCHFAPQNDG